MSMCKAHREHGQQLGKRGPGLLGSLAPAPALPGRGGRPGLPGRQPLVLGPGLVEQQQQILPSHLSRIRYRKDMNAHGWLHDGGQQHARHGLQAAWITECIA